MEPAAKLVAGTDGQHYVNKLLGKVAVWKDNAIILLDPSAILYFTVVNKRVAVHAATGIYESGSSLDELEKRFYADGFFRSHKSFVVNMEYVEKIVPWFNSTYMMKLKGEAGQIPVSRHYVKNLRSMLDI
jgi:DNA-binding LytR/AlgR family response regulator